MSTELTENDPIENPLSSETEVPGVPDSSETAAPVAGDTLSREDEILIRYRQAQVAGEALPIELQRLSGMNFLGRDFSGLDLSGCDFTGSELSRCNFKGWLPRMPSLMGQRCSKLASMEESSWRPPFGEPI